MNGCIQTDLSSRAQPIVDALRSSGRSVVTAESCTGGLVAAVLSHAESASECLHGGFVVYTKAQKHAALGVEARIIHIPSDFIIACWPSQEGSFVGDKSVSVVFDNTKIRRFVPDYCATTRFDQGIRRTLAWFQADPARQMVDEAENAVWDKVIDAYEKGLNAAVQSFR